MSNNKKIMVQLSQEDYEALLAYASRRNFSKSAAVRNAINIAVEGGVNKPVINLCCMKLNAAIEEIETEEVKNKFMQISANLVDMIK